ncbi:hypothetical protein PFFCH_01981 [Plasmodium falciparum FCH/4]|uniref:Uncharacterized protein n=1 Tax=Plasmodium falciparum FCH/4 TaxID=1036724 RepID=A0A024VPB1_PLAFA|nr:hypothetical protein PFFCH_01981 [Plasmodium falciparum FCH/4]
MYVTNYILIIIHSTKDIYFTPFLFQNIYIYRNAQYIDVLFAKYEYHIYIYIYIYIYVYIYHICYKICGIINKYIYIYIYIYVYLFIFMCV